MENRGSVSAGLGPPRLFDAVGYLDLSRPAQPLLKWPGGKRQVLPAIRRLVPASFATYIEPFLGGAAVLFDLAPGRAVVNDINAELINFYRVVRDRPDEMIEILTSWNVSSSEYYSIRGWDREPDSLTRHSEVERAARTIYLNRSGFNGLHRVNAKGQYNVAYGKSDSVNICDKDAIHAVSEYFSKSDIDFRNEDFREVIATSGPGDFIYVDPPYAPLDNADEAFTRYTEFGFTNRDLEDLRDCLDAASERGASWLLSNVRSEFTTRTFPTSKYEVQEVYVSRGINNRRRSLETVGLLGSERPWQRGNSGAPVREILVSPKPSASDTRTLTRRRRDRGQDPL